jgi:hypothetical protein
MSRNVNGWRYAIWQQACRGWLGCGCTQCVRAWATEGSFKERCCEGTREYLRQDGDDAP